MDTTDRLLEAVSGIYESAFDIAARPEALRKLGECVGARSVQFFTTDLQSERIIDAATGREEDQRHNEDYVSYYGAIDPRCRALMERPAGQILRCHEEFDEQYVGRSQFYQDFFLKTGLRWIMCSRYEEGDGTTSALALMRESGTQPFDDAAKRHLDRLMPHLRRASVLQCRIATHAVAALDINGLLQTLPMACLLIDAKGRCLSMNAAASGIAADFRFRNMGFLHFADQPTQLTWLRALNGVSLTGIPQAFNADSVTGGSMRVHVIPLSVIIRGTADQDRNLMVTIVEPVVRIAENRVDRFARTHGLTDAERSVTRLLCEGLTVKAIASERGCSIATVRNQLATTYSKSQTRSQRELVVAVHQGQ